MLTHFQLYGRKRSIENLLYRYIAEAHFWQKKHSLQLVQLARLQELAKLKYSGVLIVHNPFLHCARFWIPLFLS